MWMNLNNKLTGVPSFPGSPGAPGLPGSPLGPAGPSGPGGPTPVPGNPCRRYSNWDMAGTLLELPPKDQNDFLLLVLSFQHVPSFQAYLGDPWGTNKSNVMWTDEKNDALELNGFFLTGWPLSPGSPLLPGLPGVPLEPWGPGGPGGPGGPSLPWNHNKINITFWSCWLILHN